MPRSCNTQNPTELVRWTDEMDTVLLNALLDQQYLGGRPDGCWTTTAYNEVASHINNVFGMSIGRENIKNRLKTLKKNFHTAYDMFNSLSGFSWNSMTKMFDAEDEVWNDLIQVKPQAAKFKRCVVKHYDTLKELYADDRATGKNAETAKDKLKRWEKEKNPIDVNETMNTQSMDDVELQSMGDPADSPIGNASIPSVGGGSQSAGTTISRGSKRKSHHLDLLEEHYEKVSVGIGALADAVRDGNAISDRQVAIADRQVAVSERQADLSEKQVSLVQEQVELARRGMIILEHSITRQYSEADVWEMLGDLGVSNQYKRCCYKYLIKNEDAKREVFGVPPDERLRTLSDIMLEAGFGPRN